MLIAVGSLILPGRTGRSPSNAKEAFGRRGGIRRQFSRRREGRAMPYVWSKNRKLGVLGSVYSEILRGDDGVSQRAKNWRATMSVPRIPTPENTILPSLTVSLDSSALISWNRSLRSDSCLASISLRRD